MTVKKLRGQNHSGKRHKIVHYDEAHEWVKDNVYLRTGHRVHFDSFTITLKSLFMKHNETMNIWIHLIGVIVFGLMLSYLFLNYSQSAEIFSNIKGEFKNSDVVQKISHLGQDLLEMVTNEKKDLESNYHELISRLNVLKAQRGDYIQALKAIFEEKQLDFIHSFERKTKKLNNSFNRMIDRIAEGLKNSQYNMQNLKYFVEHCFSEEKFQTTLFYSFHGYLEYYPVIVFIICAILCLGFSTIFHWFHVMNPTVYKVLHKLDYAGISFLNFGSSYACFFYYFYCNAWLFRIFGGLIFIACTIVFVVSMTDYMDRPENTTQKGLMYGGLGISNLLPSIFIGYLMFLSDDDSHYLPLEKSFFGLMFMGVLYLVGLAFYITKFPERCYPGKFDIFFNSHNIWHFFVFFAAGQHLLNLIWLYNLRTEYPCKHCIVN